MNFNPIRSVAAAALTITTCFASAVQAQPAQRYEVSITNLTEAQAFTPFILATHSADISLFTPGEPASDELATLAEGGAVGPLADLLELFPGEVRDVVTTGGLLLPGDTLTVEISADGGHGYLSLAAMLIPTNDSFVGVNALALPNGRLVTMAPAYDAGSEPNDELCSSIPGPVCGGEGASPLEDGEGYVFISQGIQGIGDLPSETYDWRNPVAYVAVRRARGN